MAAISWAFFTQMPRSFLESSTLQVRKSHPFLLLGPTRKFCHFLPCYTQTCCSSKEAQSYCSCPRECTRRDAALDLKPRNRAVSGHSSLKTLPSGKETAAHKECKRPQLHSTLPISYYLLTTIHPLWFMQIRLRNCMASFIFQFENGSDHTVVASYSEMYEEGEAEISTVYGQFPS